MASACARTNLPDDLKSVIAFLISSDEAKSLSLPPHFKYIPFTALLVFACPINRTKLYSYGMEDLSPLVRADTGSDCSISAKC